MVLMTPEGGTVKAVCAYFSIQLGFNTPKADETIPPHPLGASHMQIHLEIPESDRQSIVEPPKNCRDREGCRSPYQNSFPDLPLTPWATRRSLDKKPKAGIDLGPITWRGAGILLHCT